MNETDVKLISAISHRHKLRSIAIMRGVRFGVSATDEIGLSFGAYIAEGVGAPQFLPLGSALKVIAAYDVSDTRNLEGKPCWVTIENGICTFESPCLI